MSDNPYEAQIRALLAGGAAPPLKMNNDATAQWAAQEAERQIKENRQLLTSRTLAARQQKQAAREVRQAEQEKRLAAQERQQARELEASKRRDWQAGWEGSRADFNAAFPKMFENYLVAQGEKNLAALRRQSPAWGVI
jgi:hypothetical protein